MYNINRYRRRDSEYERELIDEDMLQLPNLYRVYPQDWRCVLLLNIYFLFVQYI